MINIVIIGCNGLIGKYISTSLLAKGYSLFLGDISLLPDKSLENSMYKQVDIANEESLSLFFDFALSTLGHIDVFIPLAYPRASTWGQSLSSLSFADINLHLSHQIGTSLLM